MLIAKITSKGQITIPKAVREKLGLSPGEDLIFTEKDEVFTIRKVIRKSPFDKWVGYLKKRKGTTSDNVVDELRGK
jgi:antitoxin PrlF